MELGLLVNTRTWVCFVQYETLSSVYLMICAPYETGILFYRELHGTGSLSKLSYLGCFVHPETLLSVYLMICVPYETGILFYRELHGTGSLIKFLYLCPFAT
jgi:deoxyinosine 3'endonuclease (endonuclease V)